jgi:hypothetical protein
MLIQLPFLYLNLQLRLNYLLILNVQVDRLKEDVAYLKDNAEVLKIFQELLHTFEFQDAEIDVFVDETSEYHIVVIIDIPKIEINKLTGGILKKQINDNFRNLEANNPDFTFVERESNISKNNNGALMKFKHNVKNWKYDNFGVFHTNYIYTNSTKSYNIIEINTSTKDISDYIWSLK